MSAHTISQRLRQVKKIPPELIPLGKLYMLSLASYIPSTALPSAPPSTPPPTSSSLTRPFACPATNPKTVVATTKRCLDMAGVAGFVGWNLPICRDGPCRIR
ncbi:hypothetical protein DPV78_009281 [Talaromyces pinophilus]|nr:hypothetical protein DPV78_009281 [Talaromyces pinophilus]